MTSEPIKTHHSRIGIVSFILEIFVWTFSVVIIILVTQTDLPNEFFTPIKGLKNDNFGLSGLLKGFFWVVVLFGIIPFCGHLAGLILGIVGFFQKRKKRIFAVLGLILSGIYFLILIILSMSSAFFRTVT